MAFFLMYTITFIRCQIQKKKKAQLYYINQHDLGTKENNNQTNKQKNPTTSSQIEEEGGHGCDLS